MKLVRIINGNLTIEDEVNRQSIKEYIGKINIEEITNNYLLNLEKQNIDGYNIYELYKFRGINMYDFYRGSLFDILKKRLNIIEYIRLATKYYNKEDIVIETDDSMVDSIARKIFDIKQINIISNTNYSKDKNNIYFTVKRQLKSINSIIKFKSKREKNRILAFTQVGAINKIEIEGRVIYYDSLYSDVLKLIKKESSIIQLQYLNNKNMIKNSFKLDENIVAFEFFIILKKILIKKSSDEITNNLNLIKKFKFEYSGLNIMPVIEDVFVENYKNHLDNYINEIKAYEKLIKFLKIKKVIVVDEADRLRCLITAANLNNIDTFAIQHGIINNTSAAYLVKSNDKRIIANQTFLWGENFKKFLIDNVQAYDDRNLTIVGQPRTDYLVKKVNNYKEIDNKHMKILFATQPIEDLSREATCILFEALSKTKIKYELIVKLHPSDTNYKLYEEIANKYNIKNIKIIKEKDIYDCLLWANLVISVHSTVVLEGAILEKPSICIILPKYNDEGNFVKDGISLGVKDSNDMLEVLESKLYSKLNNGEYIKSFFYKIDGCVSVRISSEILKNMEGRDETK